MRRPSGLSDPGNPDASARITPSRSPTRCADTARLIVDALRTGTLSRADPGRSLRPALIHGLEHRAACAHAKATAMRQVPAPFDLVLTTNSGYPLDQNLYQAVKGMSAAAKIVKTGGTIICAAECRDGLPSHGSYGAVLASAPSPAALLEMISSPGYSVPDQWQVQVQAQIQTKAHVLVKTDGLRPDEIRAAHFTPIDDVEASVRETLLRAGPAATLCVLPQGPQTIPYLPD
jgi:lactate racemase